MYSSAYTQPFNHSTRHGTNAPTSPPKIIPPPYHPRRHHFSQENITDHEAEMKGLLTLLEKEVYISRGPPTTKRLPPVPVQDQKSAGKSVRFITPAPAPAPESETGFYKFKPEELDVVRASLDANKRYCQKVDDDQRRLQGSYEAVHKRAVLANVCAQFISKRFPMHPGPGDGVDLYNDILHVMRRLYCDGEVAHGALVLLRRLYSFKDGRYPRHKSQFELFLGAYILSQKFLIDDTYSSKSWATVANHRFTTQEIEKMERRMFSLLEFKVAITGDQLSDSKRGIVEEFGPLS